MRIIFGSPVLMPRLGQLLAALDGRPQDRCSLAEVVARGVEKGFSGSCQHPIGVVDAFGGIPGVRYRTGRSIKRTGAAVPPVFGGVKRLPMGVEGFVCRIPSTRLISAASFGVGNRIRRNTPSSSPSCVTCARLGNAAMRCLMKVQRRGATN